MLLLWERIVRIYVVCIYAILVWRGISLRWVFIEKLNPMETSQSLSIDSFSYSWLVNLKPSFESSFRDSLSDEEASFIEMDPKLSPSKRFFSSVPQDFNFDLPISDSPFAIVHADELISNGFLVPLFFKPMMSMESYDNNASDYSIPPTPSTSIAQMESSGRVPCSSSLRSCRRLSRQFFRKYLDFLRPICQKLRRCRFGSVNRTMQEMKNWDFSSATSPRTSIAYSVDNWRSSFDSESSIHEAVLHCKRTIGNK